MPTRGELSVESLCGHHRLDEFSSGVRQLDATARQLQERVRQRDNRDFEAFVVVRTTDAPAGRVLGIGSVTDVRLVGDQDATGNVRTGLCVFYSLLAVDLSAQGDIGVMSRLIDELELVKNQKYAQDEGYIGEVAAPLEESPESLTTFLQHRGFRQLKTDGTFWYRPRDR